MDSRQLFFLKPGALEGPLYVASEVFRCSTTVGLGWDCDDNRIRYRYRGSLLTIIDEREASRELEPERYGQGGCIALDRDLAVERFDVATGDSWCDKVVQVQGDRPLEGCDETDGEHAPSAPPDSASSPPSLEPRLFDDSISGWLLVPAEERPSVLRISQYPGEPSLDVRTGPGTALGEG